MDYLKFKIIGKCPLTQEDKDKIAEEGLDRVIKYGKDAVKEYIERELGLEDVDIEVEGL